MIVVTMAAKVHHGERCRTGVALRLATPALPLAVPALASASPLLRHLLRVIGDGQALASGCLRDVSGLGENASFLGWNSPHCRAAALRKFQLTTQPTECDVLYDLRVFWQSPRSCKWL